jgi:hypothetical protein
MNLSRTTVPVNPTGATGSVSVMTANGCPWTASSGAEWIRITAGTSGTGAGRVSFTIDDNPTIGVRNGTLTVAGQTVTVTQEAPNLSGRWGLTGTGALRSLEFTLRGTTVTRVRFTYQFPISGGRICDRAFSEDYTLPMTDGQFRVAFQNAGMSTTLAVGFESSQLATGTLDQQTFTNVGCSGATFSGSIGGGAVAFGRVD